MTADNEEIDARHPVTLSTPIPSFANFVCTFEVILFSMAVVQNGHIKTEVVISLAKTSLFFVFYLFYVGRGEVHSPSSGDVSRTIPFFFF